jgi:exonuclease SbcC
MSGRLTQVQVTDFRSIRGTITVPLDAPVVLVHGPNGSGKTSLLSAIELGLTGAVPSLNRFDQTYAENLVHYDAARSSVTIAASHTALPDSPAKLTVEEGEISGTRLLSAAQSRFFTERSFLAQATLSRLLEIYEQSDAKKTASPLTRFVNDLLGLDQLDTLVEGLHSIGHKSRLVKSLPLYGETSHELDDRNREVDRLTEEVKAVKADLAEKATTATEALEALGLHSAVELDEQRSQLGDGKAEQREAVTKATLKRDIEAAQSVWSRLDQEPGGEARAAAESALQSHRAALDLWAKDRRPALEAALSAAATLFADLSPARSVGWSSAHREAVRELTEDLAKAQARLARDETVRKGLAELREAVAKACAREERLDESLGALAANSGELAQVLSELSPLVKDEICPVCQRDFSETGTTSLRTHLAMHISTLSQTASRLRSVAAERQTVRKEITDHRRELARLEEDVLGENDVTALRTRCANVIDALRQLEKTGEAAQEGDALHTGLEEASERLATLRRDEEALIGVRRSAATFAAQLSLDPPGESESVGAILDRCLAAVDQVLATAHRREQFRKRAEDALNLHSLVKNRLGELDDELRQTRAKQKQIKDAIKAADGVRSGIRMLSARALEARTAVVREVFNDSLNMVWNNLFIRLAPEEPFLPAFELPENGKGPVEAKLITRYRGDDRGGNPKTMLSAGNLNTAALTLFLSLHLSVKPLLPWLVIDDPVQSMDEIHIAQFAALLRTLAKQRQRQLIIAVHERPLFEYLALELSPASPGDRLITVELSKDGGGETVCDAKSFVWDPEQVFRANAA